MLNARIAQYFFMGEHYYMYFMQEHDRALRQPEIQPDLAGVRLPP